MARPRMIVKDRIERIQHEISGVAAQFGVTSWEQEFLRDNVDKQFLSERQRDVLREIEKKVFTTEDDDE